MRCIACARRGEGARHERHAAPTLHDLGPVLALILFGFLPNEVWRLVGLMLVRGLDEKSQIIVWVRAVATAMLAGVMAQLILSTSGPLAGIPVGVRVGAAVLGFVAFLIARRSVFVGVLTGEAAVLLGTYLFACLALQRRREFERLVGRARRAFPSRWPAASSGRRPCAG